MPDTLFKLEDIKNTVKESNLNHIAIIMDGNRRWAKQRMLPSAAGHKKGVESLRTAIKACKKFGIKYLTVYAFSTENWKREKTEVDFLMELLAKTIVNELPLFQENNIRLMFIGNRNQLKDDLKNILNYGEEQTKNNDGVTLIIAFNYGARSEIVNAVKQIAENVKNGFIDIFDITEDMFSQYLYTAEIPVPELVIRTGGELRLSNFLLWQCAYAELYSTEKYWPDFDENSLCEAIFEFSKRKRRFGK